MSPPREKLMSEKRARKRGHEAVVGTEKNSSATSNGLSTSATTESDEPFSETEKSRKRLRFSSLDDSKSSDSHKRHKDRKNKKKNRKKKKHRGRFVLILWGVRNGLADRLIFSADKESKKSRSHDGESPKSDRIKFKKRKKSKDKHKHRKKKRRLALAQAAAKSPPIIDESKEISARTEQAPKPTQPVGRVKRKKRGWPKGLKRGPRVDKTEDVTEKSSPAGGSKVSLVLKS